MDTRSKSKTARLDKSNAPVRRLPIDDDGNNGNASNSTPAPTQGESTTTLSSISIPGTQQLADFETPRTSQPHAQSSDAPEDEVQMNLSAEDRETLNQMDDSSHDPEPPHPTLNRHVRDQMRTFTQLDRNVLTTEQYQQWLLDQGFMLNPAERERQANGNNGRNTNASADQQLTGNQDANRQSEVNNGASTSNSHHENAVNYGASTSMAHRIVDPNDGASTVFSANPGLQLNQVGFPLPPRPLRVVAPEIGSQRKVVATLFDYLHKINDYKARIQSEPMDEETLRLIVANTERYVDRIVRYVEHREKSCLLEPDELEINETLWEQAIDVGSHVKINANTKLRYLEAGNRAASAPKGKAQARLNAKIVPFSGEWEDWPNFRALWTEYYHNCDDLTKLDLIIKLDEFIVPRSEPHQLIASYDRSLKDAYDVAWNRLCATYDNRRRQVDDVIEKFVTMPTVEDNRASYLIVQAHITTLLEALPRFGIDVTSWDPILMHTIEKKLIGEVKVKWHQKRAPREVARLQPFMEFLTREIDAADGSNAPAPVPHELRYDSNDRHQSNERRSQQNHQRSNDRSSSQSNRSNGNSHSNNNGHNNGSNSRSGPPNSSNGHQRQQTNGGASNGPPRRNDRPQKPKKCPVCFSAEHSIYSCTEFNSANLEGRKTKAKKANVCFNCLRLRCSTERCTLGTCPNGCKEKHYRLLCPKSFTPTVSAVQQADGGQQ